MGRTIAGISPSWKKLRHVWGSVLLLATVFLASMTCAKPGPDEPTTVVFVCLHGSVKSQVAAAHFNRLAKERGLNVVAVSRGIAVNNAIPASIRDGLSRDGLAPATDTPVALTAQEATAAAKVFAFDEVPDGIKGNAEVTYWSDVPPATKDYAGARAAIVRHFMDAIDAVTPQH